MDRIFLAITVSGILLAATSLSLLVLPNGVSLLRPASASVCQAGNCGRVGIALPFSAARWDDRGASAPRD